MGWKLNLAGATGKWFIKAAFVGGFVAYVLVVAIPMYFPGFNQGPAGFNRIFAIPSIIPTSSSTPKDYFYFSLITFVNLVFFYYALRSFRKMFAL